MCKQIIEQGMGGRLSARPLETGAEFTLLTPLAFASALAISGRRGQLIQQAFPVPMGNYQGVRVFG